MKISYIFRSTKLHSFSIENVFNAIIPIVKTNYEVELTYVPQYRVSVKNIIQNLKVVRNIRSEIYHITGDIHYVSLVTPRKRTILTIHDMVSLENSKGLKRQILKLLWYTLPIKKCIYITTISEKSREEIINVFPDAGKKITVIPDPVDDSFTYYQKKFNKKKPVILQIGTKENKNLIRLINAIESIECELRIIGRLNAEQIKLLKEKKICYSNKYNLPFEEIVKQYQECDLVAFVSTYEGFGMPIIEAQATGRAVISSNIEPMKSVAGKGALLVNPYDISEIRKGITKIILEDDYRNKIVEQGLINAQKYSAAEVAKCYMNLYQQIEEK